MLALRHCATVGVKPHPARFPEKLPTFFIEFLTDPGGYRMSKCEVRSPKRRPDTGKRRIRKSLFEIRPSNRLAGSAFRFVDELPAGQFTALWSRLHSDELPVEVNRQQREMALREPSAPYGTK